MVVQPAVQQVSLFSQSNHALSEALPTITAPTVGQTDLKPAVYCHSCTRNHVSSINALDLYEAITVHAGGHTMFKLDARPVTGTLGGSSGVIECWEYISNRGLVALSSSLAVWCAAGYGQG